ncbi:hypothetical protein B0H14DRAFT_3431268 [Mycena olivaceomarginata]|nr:hypothetical protein B0H14DRAFT_3431268 [Mycena olivaceomarginata]
MENYKSAVDDVPGSSARTARHHPLQPVRAQQESSLPLLSPWFRLLGLWPRLFTPRDCRHSWLRAPGPLFLLLPADATSARTGGIHSSPAFASEHAKDAEKFVALNLETRDRSVSLSTQMKRDFLLSQAAPSTPLGFAAGPSLAHRPVSRTGFMVGEVANTPTDLVPDDIDVTPVFLPNHKEKEKAETAVSAAAQTNGNITRIGGKLIAVEAKVDAQALDIANQLRAIETQVARMNPGKLESEIQLLQGMLRTGLDSMDAKVRADSRVSLHGSQLAQLTDGLDTLRHRLDRFASSLFDDNGVPVRASTIDAIMAEQLLPTTERLKKTAEVLEKVEGKVAVQATELLTARENIAGVRIDLASFAMSSKAPAPPFAVGGKKHKGDELAAEADKGGKPNKAAYHHWVKFGPLNFDTRATGNSPAFFKKVLDAGGLGKLALPSHYIERWQSDPAFLSAGFMIANEANMFIGAWSGANLAPALRTITARLAAEAVSSARTTPTRS